MVSLFSHKISTTVFELDLAPACISVLWQAMKGVPPENAERHPSLFHPRCPLGIASKGGLCTIYLCPLGDLVVGGPFPGKLVYGCLRPLYYSF